MKILEYISNPWRVFPLLAGKGFFNDIDDLTYLKCMFRGTMGRTLNLDNPQTFNEKLQWLKLHDRKPVYSEMVDKYEAKNYVSDRIGKQYIIPTLGVWNSFEEIDFDLLPDQFVLKCTHDSGGLIVCKNKSELDLENAKKKISKSLARNYYKWGREWPYKNVMPKIIAEQFIHNNSDEDLKDYKFFCFNGKVKCFKIDFDRFNNHHANYYDTDGNLLNFGEAVCPPKPDRKLELPNTIKTMEMLAENLSRGFSFLRVDFYDIDGIIYFGELTFYPQAGFGRFIPEEGDNILGSWLNLPK